MTYQPTLEDLPSSKYLPSMEDIPTSQKLIEKAQSQGISKENYKPQLQEEFSNPIQYPGFENLSQQEKLQRIALSQFDPANQTPTGGMVPGGAYESPITRGAYSILPTLAAPQVSGGNNIFGRQILAPLINAMSRIGSGTAANIASQTPNIKNLEDLKDISKNSLKMNALLEAGTIPLRAVGHAAETFNPVQFGEKKASQINNEFKAAKALQQETYRPVMDKYGEYNVTLNPKKYMDDLGIEKKGMYHQTKQLYDKFLKEPTFKNLHELQSQIGTDLRQSRVARNKPASVSRFSDYNSKLKDKVTSYLKHDPEMLEQYEKGSQITRNLVEPYRATPTLEKIAYGKIENSHPENLSNSIKKGNEKIIARKGEDAFTAIPENHPLQNHLRDLEKIINFGKLAKTTIPTLAGAIGGHIVSPGLGSLTGAGGGAALAGTLLSPVGNPLLQATAQNPLIRNVFKALSPAYYGSGRALIDEQGR